MKTLLSELKKKHIRKAVYAEARAIDEKRLHDWLGMFTEDLLYWMPLARNQQEADVHNALFFEDRLLMQVRVERLTSPRAFSQQPPSYCQHVLQKPRITRFDREAGEFQAQTNFVYLEAQMDTQICLGGTLHHDFVWKDGRLKISKKRIELLNREAALPSIQLFP